MITGRNLRKFVSRAANVLTKRGQVRRGDFHGVTIASLDVAIVRLSKIKFCFRTAFRKLEAVNGRDLSRRRMWLTGFDDYLKGKRGLRCFFTPN